MMNLLRDTRFGFRLLLKNPGFAAVAVLAIALGIGANTAIFSVVYATLLAPLPYPHPDQLVVVWSKVAGDRECLFPTGTISIGNAKTPCSKPRDARRCRLQSRYRRTAGANPWKFH